MIYEDHNIDTCTICDSNMDMSIDNLVDTRFGLKHFYSIKKCRNCELEQTFPSPRPDELKRLYEMYYNFGGEKGTAYSVLREKVLHSQFYLFWLAIDGDISFHGKRGTGRLLDVGCNEGRGLRLYRRNGFNAEGLELNEKAAEAARSHGFIVIAEPVEKLKQRDPYDVVVLSNVLEHSLDPRGMLFHVLRMLKSEGQLWISCPNSRSWLRSVFGRYWINWHVPFHIVHFSPDSLRMLLEGAGFEIVEMRHETPALWVAHSIIARVFARKGRPTLQLRNPFLVAGLMLIIRGCLFPILWLGNRLSRGDCLVVTAKKR